MATGGQSEGEVGGQIPETVAGSEDLSELKCQPCHEDGIVREAVGMCVDCQDYLCRKCFDSHTIPRPCRNHQLLDKHQMLKSQVKIQRKDTCTQKCSLHDEKIIEYYCNAHGKLGCNVCLNLDHRTCKPVQYIPHAATNLDNNAEFKETEQCLSSALKLCQKVSDIGTENVEAKETSCTEALEDVEIYRSKVNDALDKAQAEIVKKAQTMKTRALEKINTITDKYRTVQRELQEFQTRTKQFKSRQQNCDLYTDMMKMKDRLKTLEGELTEVEKEMRHLGAKLHFTPNLDFLETLRTPEIFGRLTGEQGAIIKAEHLLDINVNSTSVLGCTLLSDTTLVIADASKGDIKTVDVSQNKIISELKMSSKSWDVWDICKIKHDQLAVALSIEKKVAFVKVGGNMSVDRSINVNGSCRGLDFKNDKLAVSFSTPDKVQVMTLQGTVLHEITTSQQGQHIFNTPNYVTFDQSGTSLFVSNHTNASSVVRVKLDGTVVATYTDSELKMPLGTVVTRDGNVYVCGWNSNNIHQISPDCKKLRVLLRQANGMNAPQSISYSETEDKFYVGSHGSNIQVYRAIQESK